MKLLIFGSEGQLGRCLLPRLSGYELVVPSQLDVDFSRADSIGPTIDASRADYVINLAAYTAVDKAESEPELAEAINHLAVIEIARRCAELELPLLHISTDFVFSGSKSTPYKPVDPCMPLNRYGQSKRGGEQAILQHKPHRSIILRTAWLYSDCGANFLLTMLRLMRERTQLKIISDQTGTPTSAYSLADVIARFLSTSAEGIYHWTDAGVASWYDFAVAIYEEALARDLVPPGVEIIPISSWQYPTPARRPDFSVLDKSQTCEALHVQPQHWRRELRSVLDRMLDAASMN